jgi:hypothetical protein
MRITGKLLLTGGLMAFAAAAGRADEVVAIERTKDHVEFLVGKKLTARYEVNPRIRRPIIWPIYAPGGIPVTRAWPMAAANKSMDHIHHKSVWFCYGDVIPEGLEIKERIGGVEGVDFWSDHPNAGRIICVSVDAPVVTREHGSVVTHNEWRTKSGIKVLDENRRIFFYNFDKARLLVFDVDLNASVYPITFGDTKEGAMAIRINDNIRVRDGRGTIRNSLGQVNETGCWGRIADWCDYSGPIGEKRVGLAILSDPGNAYPSCWHSRDYGLMAANPFGRFRSGFSAMQGRTDRVKLARGDHLRLRYGILVHTGDAQTGHVAEYYQRFVKLRQSERTGR